MTSETKWPDWRNVAAGVPIEGAHVCAWPTPSHSKPMLALHQQNKPRRLIRLEFGPSIGSVAGYQCFKGINYLLVYEDEIPAIRAKIPTDEEKALMKVAQATFESRLAEFIKERTRDGVGPTREQALKDFFPTPWNIYSGLAAAGGGGIKKTGYPKVLSLEVCPDPVPPPETAQSIAQANADRNAEAIGRSMAVAFMEREKATSKQQKAAG